MIRPLFHAFVAMLAMSTSSASAQHFDEDARARDIADHFARDAGDGVSGVRDPIERTLDRGADPLRANFGPQRVGPLRNFNDGVQNYDSRNYLRDNFGDGYGRDGYFPGQWYYQNRRYISPYGGLYRYPSDRYYTR